MILPKPRTLRRSTGTFALTASTTVYADQAAAPAAEALRRALGPATGVDLPAATDQAAAGVSLTVDGSGLGPEAYTLTVTPDRIEIVGADPAGAFYGVQSLRQLLPAEAFGAERVERDWPVPAVEVEDAPAFGWRGTMLDVGRHFMPKRFVLKLIDLLALHKLNVLHLHLTEDQGWRLAVDRYPKLTEVGGWRSETLIGHGHTPDDEKRYDGTPHGGFYSKADIQEIVAYAAERFVTVVPEVDMPGHMVAALTAYPELGNGTGPYSVLTKWGISPQVLNIEESTVDFCRDVLSEVVELFPAPYVHTGGDECPRKEWEASQAVHRRMAELGLESVEDIQPWFSQRMAEFLRSKGRRMVGWDELLDGGGPEALPDDVVVMSWRTEEAGEQAAKAGLDVIMSYRHYTYLDYYQGDPQTEPLGIGGDVPLEKVYEYHVVPSGLDEQAAGHVLGSQVQLWTEYMPNPEHVEYMWLPRACAFAEAVWRDRSAPVDPYDTFVADRLRPHLARLDAIGVNYRPFA